METICSDGQSQWSADSVTDGRGIHLAITTTDFLSALVITNSCLKYLQALTSNLQAEARDIVERVSSVKAALQDVRDTIATHHSQWFKTVEQMLAMRSQVYPEDVAVNVVVAMFLLTLHLNTTAVAYLFQFLITCFQKWSNVSAHISKLPYWVSP